MEAVAGSAVAGACPACGRRYVPARPACTFCPSDLEPSTPRTRARVLAHTRVHRAPRGAVVSSPYLIAWLQEEPEGAVFLAPLEGDGVTVSIGSTVAVEVRTWPTQGGTFSGVVGVPEAA